MPLDDETTCKLTAVERAEAVHAGQGQRISRRPAALALVAAAYGLGGGGMLAWLGFLLLGPPALLDPGLSTLAVLLWDALLCLLFFVQHSIMVRRRFRLWLVRNMRADFHGAFYASAAGTCLLILVGLWQPGPILGQPPAWIRWAMIVLFLAAGMGGWWGSRSLGDFDALGVGPALRSARGRPARMPETFVVRGPYRWVRHPLYLFSLIIIWCGPVFTLDRLLHNGLWTVWIVIGAAMEERDLVACFGDAYRTYRRRVPMLLPRSLRPRVPADSPSPAKGDNDPAD